MPITKTYLNKKTVAQVRAIANRKKIATKGKAKPQLISAIMKYEAQKNTKIKAPKPKIAYAYKKAGNKYILAAKKLQPGSKTMIKLDGRYTSKHIDVLCRLGFKAATHDRKKHYCLTC